MKVQSIRTQLLALSVICLALIAGLSALVVHGSRSDAAAMGEIYEQGFQPMLALQDADRQLKEVRFRLAGVLLDQIPVPGSRNHLRDVRARAPALWAEYLRRAGQGEGERLALGRQIDAGWQRFERFAGELDAAYAGNDRKRLGPLLEDAWPTVHTELVKPLEKLLPLAIKEAEAVYAERTAAAARRQAVAAIGFALAVVLLAAFLVRFNRRLREAFDRMGHAMRQLAEGDLSARLDCQAFAETVGIGREFNVALKQLQSLMHRVDATSHGVRAACGEIAQANADLSTRTEQQASALEETSASMQQMTATVGQNAQNAKKASALAEQASDVAARGGLAMGIAVGAMTGISDSSKQIADIVGVIDGIAFQTNILALNAAVEAARAGEQGRGFAVVAAEVRSLAQRSAAAAKEIRQLIAESVERIESGTGQVETAGETMGEIVGSVKKVSALIAEITTASGEQAQGIEQISETMTQLEKVTQQNAAMVEQANAAAGSLGEQSRVLADAVAVFRLAHGTRE